MLASKRIKDGEPVLFSVLMHGFVAQRYFAIFCCIAAALCCFLPTSRLISIGAFVCFAAYIANALLCRIDFFIRYFWVISFTCMQIVGVLSVEFFVVGLPELATTSYFSGSLPLIVLARMLLLISIELFDSLFQSLQLRGANPVESRLDKLVCYASGAVLLVVLLLIARDSVPAFIGSTDRFVYQEGISSFVLKILYSSFPLLAVCLVSISLKPIALRVLGCLGVAAYLLSHLWIGNKFSELMAVIAIALLFFHGRISTFAETHKKRFIFMGSALLLALLCYAVAVQTAVVGSSPAGYFASRTAQQGQMWWMTYQKSTEPHIDELDNELMKQIQLDDDPAANIREDYGLFKIMYLCAPEHIVDQYLSSGVTFAEMGYSIAYYYLGAFGTLAFSVVTALLLALTTNALLLFMNRGWCIEVALVSRFYSSFNAILGMGGIHILFTPLSIASYVALFVMWMIRRQSSRDGGNIGRQSSTTKPSNSGRGLLFGKFKFGQKSSNGFIDD